ncbi:MAG: restriction endonuclease subunit S [Rhodocyclaceae bacterium]|nr:restriction endonuclease subunit S [Rhodocyclaceae bacterium]
MTSQPRLQEFRLGDVCEIAVGRDLVEDRFSVTRTDKHVYPVFSNSVENYGLYGFYDFPEYERQAVTVVGRGAGLGAAFIRRGEFGAIGRLLVLFPSQNVDPNYLVEYINDKIEFFVESSGIPQLTGQQCAGYKILLPSIPEQQVIAAVLTNWNEAIQKTGGLIAANERHYTHELSRLISHGKYSHSHVGNFTHEVSERNRGGNDERVLSVTNSRGFVLPEDQFERRVASADLSNYKVVVRGQYAYNPSRINVGSIARLDDWDMGVLSPMYVVFGLDHAKVNSDYFLHWLDSHEARERIKKSAQGSVRETVSFTEFAAIAFPLPDLDRQAAIARYLNTLRDEISTLGVYAEKLKEQKRGLMQKLLTSQRRVRMESKEVAA